MTRPTRSGPARAVHPHVDSDHAGIRERAVTSAGSPPHRREPRPFLRRQAKQERFTPAFAGVYQRLRWTCPT